MNTADEMNTAEDLLTQIHKVLYPEHWNGCDPAKLNGEGVYEWSPDDLEKIGYIIQEAVELDCVKPDKV